MSSAKKKARTRKPTIKAKAPATPEPNPVDSMAYAVETRINEARTRIGVLCALFAANDGDSSGVRMGQLANRSLNQELAGQVRWQRREDFNVAVADVLFQLQLAQRGLDALARNAGGQGCAWSGSPSGSVPS